MNRHVLVVVLVGVCGLLAGCPTPNEPALEVSTGQLTFALGENVKTFEVWNGGGGRLFFDVAADRDWISVAPEIGASDGPDDPVEVTVTLADGAKSNEFFQGTVTVTAADDATEAIGVTAGLDTFTQEFTGETFDLANTAVTFTPDPNASYNYYVARVTHNLTALPTNPTGGSVLNDIFPLFGDPVEMPLQDSKSVQIYGQAYDSIHVASNGYVVFGDEAMPGRPSMDLTGHFSRAGVSPYFTDVDLSSTGEVVWQQLPNRVAITWLGVASVGEAGTSTFQVELFYDGRVRISCLEVAASPGIVGLSAGVAPAAFAPSDLSAYPAGTL